VAADHEGASLPVATTQALDEAAARSLGRKGDGVITRIWRGWVRTEDASDYVAYITGTGLADYRRTPGNRGAQMLTRDLGGGRTEVLTLSWWESLDSIRGFAGDDPEAARFYPEDDRYLLDRETTVAHYEAFE